MKILSASTRVVLYEDDADTIAESVQAAVKAGASLAGAYLAGACLTGACLTRANLTRAYLAGANLTRAYLTGAYLARANLTRANLTRANLAGADLTRANLAGANLTRAYLTGADLTGAYLDGAYLTGAKGIPPERTTDLLLLLDQPGKIRAYKLVNENSEGPYNGGIKYEVGGKYEVDDADTNPSHQCAAGISLATLPWCLRVWRKSYRVLIAEFEAKDIAAIPTATDGKFRVHRCEIVGEKDISGVVE